MFDALINTTDSALGWVWRDPSGAVQSPFVLFVPDGRIGGSAASRYPSWRHSAGGVILTCVDGAEAPLAGTIHPGRPWPIRPLPPLRTGRRNLVVLRAGDQSLHPLWLETMGAADRNWDLFLSYYGDQPDLWRGQCEYFAPLKGSKYGGLNTLIHSEPLVWEYDYIWFPDDDLLIEGSDINLMFSLVRQHHLLLAQPALAPGCFINHRITEQQPDFRLRFTSFVEIMAPLFAREALAIVAPSFGLNDTGYGLDHLWPALLGAPQTRIAVLDQIAMVHTRPMGANYDVTNASNQGWDLLDQFGLGQLYVTYGALSQRTQGLARNRGEAGKLI